MKDTDRLHRLRIEGKTLRYLLEFFRDMLSIEKPLIVTLKRLQDYLGRFNDLRVQQDSVTSIIGRLEAAGSTQTSTLAAARRLLEQLAEKEQRVRGRFADEFGRFDSEETANRIPTPGVSQ
jgi:CHAD domain-containing protein